MNFFFFIYTVVVKPEILKANVTCVLCEFVMNKIKDMLKANASEVWH